ncbi:type II toxin-antitoxin system Phd/YefM family antitoxin [Nocardiopsis sp. EMB25]|uniref:type II toxin-antitoxin system Phd/YefM family antitoxin n=1 Tax=Nocardiopsis sp. EMB25 TaxID=2835867 RepID=UPI0022852DCA|nr:type II toxin-antitoxin system Phd/YefM family antitoxin [Nocardiopsis sp. EMB25]MCY9785381.1 type II toxin-antitoxin system Phd/YefM family antitoxin [Nocardiopsis sp. EMB25]
MMTMPLAEVRNNLSKIVDDVERTHDSVTITRNGKPSAVVISVDDYESLLETFALLESSEEQERLREAEESIEAGDVTTAEEMVELLRERAEREDKRE